jgi:hypothetical protein
MYTLIVHDLSADGPNGKSTNKAHLVTFFISFQKIIALKIPLEGLLVAQGLDSVYN